MQEVMNFRTLKERDCATVAERYPTVFYFCKAPDADHSGHAI
jgi:hypothetical protein